LESLLLTMQNENIPSKPLRVRVHLKFNPFLFYRPSVCDRGNGDSALAVSSPEGIYLGH